MTNYYLDIETTGLDPKESKIITIQFQKLDRYTGKPEGDLVILKEWESSEKEILSDFIEMTGIINAEDDFNFVSTGYNLGFEHNFLKERTKINGLPVIDILNKPFIDLRSIGILMNSGQFKGSGLDKITGKKSDGSNIPNWYLTKEYQKIIDYILNETEEFLFFNSWLYSRMPELLSEFKRELD